MYYLIGGHHDKITINMQERIEICRGIRTLIPFIFVPTVFNLISEHAPKRAHHGSFEAYDYMQTNDVHVYKS